MAKEPTDKQRAVFDFICEAIRREGRPPTVREITDHFDYASPKAASDHLAALARKGYLSRPQRKARNIQITAELDPRGIPVIRQIEPDTPVLTLANVEKSLSVTKLFSVDQDTVAVQVRDNSMQGVGIHEGDYVIVQTGEDVENGAIGAVQVEDRILVRRLYFEVNSVRWTADATGSADVVVSRNDPGFRILGPVKGMVKAVR